MNQIHLYLAGPDVFLPDAVEIGRAKREMCAGYGFVGLYPLDNEVAGPRPGMPVSLQIYRGNIGLMRKAHGIVANLTPFRGPSADPGTTFELGGFAFAGKPCFGYSNVPGAYFDRTAAGFGKIPFGDMAVDEEGLVIEDFGLEDNLMMIHALEGAAAPGENPLVTAPRRPVGFDETWRDLAQFEECLRRARRHFDGIAVAA